MAEEAVETIKIAAEEQGQRLDRVLAARIPALSRSRLKALILDGQVAIAARTIRDPASHVKSGDTVTVTLPAPQQPNPPPPRALTLGGRVAIAARTTRDPASHVKSGDTVTVTLPAPEQPKPAGEPIPLNIVYEDDALIVIDKPSGLGVHRAAG